MGTLTFTQLQAEIQAGLGGRTDLSARLPTFVNLAQQRLSRIFDFDEMDIIATTTINNTGNNNDKFIVLPNLRDIYSLRLVDNAVGGPGTGSQARKLQQVHHRKWDKLIPYPEWYSRGKPTHYMVWGQFVELWRLPDFKYTVYLRYTKWPTPLSLGTDLSDFNMKDELLIELAIIYAYRSLGRMEDAIKHQFMFGELWKEFRDINPKNPDLDLVPGPGITEIDPTSTGNYWANPFITTVSGGL